MCIKLIALVASVVTLSACQSYTAQTYSISPDTVRTVKNLKLNESVGVGEQWSDYVGQSLLDTQRECIERMLAHPEQFESWRQVWVAAELALLDTAEQLIC